MTFNREFFAQPNWKWSGNCKKTAIQNRHHVLGCHSSLDPVLEASVMSPVETSHKWVFGESWEPQDPTQNEGKWPWCQLCCTEAVQRLCRRRLPRFSVHFQVELIKYYLERTELRTISDRSNGEIKKIFNNFFNIWCNHYSKGTLWVTEAFHQLYPRTYKPKQCVHITSKPKHLSGGSLPVLVRENQLVSNIWSFSCLGS